MAMTNFGNNHPLAGSYGYFSVGRTVTNRFETFRCQACGRGVKRKGTSLATDGGVVSRQSTDARFLKLGRHTIHGEEKAGYAIVHRKKQNPR
jgi:hypothetical protein